MNQGKLIKLTNGKSAYEWTSKEKPALNHWYMCIDSESDYWKKSRKIFTVKRTKQHIIR